MRAILFFVSVVVLIGIVHMVSKAAARKAAREPFESCGDAVDCQDGKHKHVVARKHNSKVLTHAACCDPGSYINTPTAASSECTACPDAEGVPSEHYDKLTNDGEGMLNDANSAYTVTRRDTRRSCKTRCKVGTTNEGVWDKDREKYFMADGRQFMCKKYFALEQVTDDMGRPYTSLQKYTWDQDATVHDPCPSGQTTVPEGAEPSEGDFCCTDFDNPSNLRISLDKVTTRCCENQTINVDGVCKYCPVINKNDLLNTVTDIEPIGSKTYTQQSGACSLSSTDRGVCQGPTAYETKWRSDALRTNAGFTTYDRGCDVTVDKAVVMPNVNLFNTALHKVRYDEVEINAYAPTVQDQLEEKLFGFLDSNYLVFQPSGKWNNQVTSDSAIATNAYMMYAPGQLSVANNVANALSLSTGTTIIDNLFACSNTNAGDSQFLRKTEGDLPSFGCCPSGTYLGGTGAQIRCVEPESGFEILDDVMVSERMTKACPVGFGVSDGACWPCADRDASAIVKQHGKWYSSNVGRGDEQCTEITDDNTFSSNGVADDIVVATIPSNTMLGVGTPVNAVVVSESGNKLKKMTANDYANLDRGDDGELEGFGPTSATVYLTSASSLKTATVSEDASITYLVHVDTSGFEKPVVRFLKNSLSNTAQNIEDLFFRSADDYLDADGNDKRLVVTKIDRPTTNISPDGNFTDTSAIAYDFDILTAGGYDQVDLNTDHRKFLIRPMYSPDYVDTCVPTTAVNINRNRLAYHSVDPNGMCSDCDPGSNVNPSKNHQCELTDTNCGHSATNDVFANQETDGTWTCVSVEEDFAIDPLDPTGDLVDCRSLGFQRVVRSDGMISQIASNLTCDECSVGMILMEDASGVSSCEPCPINTKQVGTNCVACEIWESTGGSVGSSECTACGGLSYRSINSDTCDAALRGNEYFSSGEQVPIACGSNQIRSPLGTEPYVAQTASQICTNCEYREYLDPVKLECAAFGPGDEGKKRDATDTTNGWSWCLANEVRNPYAENTCSNITDVDEYRGERTRVGDLPLNSRKDTNTKSVLGYVECPANSRRKLNEAACAPCYEIDRSRPVRGTGDADCRGLYINEFFRGGNVAPQECDPPDYVTTDNWATGTTKCVSCTDGTYKVSGANECRSLTGANEERRSCGENPAVSEGKRTCGDLTKYRGTNGSCCEASCGTNRARPNEYSETCLTLPEGKLDHSTWCPVNQRRQGSSCLPCPDNRPIRGLEQGECDELPDLFHERDNDMTGTRDTSTTGAKLCDAHQKRTRFDAPDCDLCPPTRPWRPQDSTSCEPHPMGDSHKLVGNRWEICPLHEETSADDRSTCKHCGPGEHRPASQHYCTRLTTNRKYPSSSERSTLVNCPYHQARINSGTSIYECDNCPTSQYTAVAGNNCTDLHQGWGRVDGAPQQMDCGGKPRTLSGTCQTCKDDEIWYTNQNAQEGCKTAIDIGNEYKTANFGTPFDKGYRLLTTGVGNLNYRELLNPLRPKFEPIAPHYVRTSDDDIADTGTTLCDGRQFRNSDDSNCVDCANDRVLTTDGNTKSCDAKTDPIFSKPACRAYTLSAKTELSSSDRTRLGSWTDCGTAGTAGGVECAVNEQRSGNGVFDECEPCGRTQYRNRAADPECQECAGDTYPIVDGSSTECVDFTTSSPGSFAIDSYLATNKVYRINTNNINNVAITNLYINADYYLGGTPPNHFAECPPNEEVDPSDVTKCKECPSDKPIRPDGQSACKADCNDEQYYNSVTRVCEPLEPEYGWSKDGEGRTRGGTPSFTPTTKYEYLVNKRYANIYDPPPGYISDNHGSFYDASDATNKEDCAHHCKYFSDIKSSAKSPTKGGGCTYFKFSGNKCRISTSYDKRITPTISTRDTDEYGYRMNYISSHLSSTHYDTNLADDYICYRDEMCASKNCDLSAHNNNYVGLCKTKEPEPWGATCDDRTLCDPNYRTTCRNDSGGTKRCLKNHDDRGHRFQCHDETECKDNMLCLTSGAWWNTKKYCYLNRTLPSGQPCSWDVECRHNNCANGSCY